MCVVFGEQQTTTAAVQAVERMKIEERRKNEYFNVCTGSQALKCLVTELL